MDTLVLRVTLFTTQVQTTILIIKANILALMIHMQTVNMTAGETKSRLAKAHKQMHKIKK